MEFIKIKQGSRTTEHSPHIRPQRHKQIHNLQFIFKNAKDGLFELGWEIKIIEDNLVKAKIVTTDTYEIKDIETNATEEQLKQVIYETFQVAKYKYNEEKASLLLLRQLKSSPDDEMPQTLQELTRILLTIREYPTQ